MEQQVITSPAPSTVNIVIQGHDTAGNLTEKIWKLCIDYRALSKIEETLGRDLQKVEAWANLSAGRDFPKVIHCCLSRYSPDVTLDDVIDKLNPQAHHLLFDALFELTFPGAIEAWQKKQAEAPETFKTEVEKEG